MAQIAFSLIALVGSALFIHSLRNAEQVDPGFETRARVACVSESREPALSAGARRTILS